ncbi:helix-turn-helix transcriptional regulator [Sabulicella glaciei]|uniref:Helix-turn-helix domain-containing protein n=1 Tax=Sabulicella glaciei TaxID=2984948 RepID=A0ABT3P0V3_9PROT|nr:helix-turn-helix domain-containing protein [Roseococcus sp. MDT2-1-1]MCW8088037.1 helix-turn-helix domain-containing protein [Roseococcus sp. MDT2-1-1]
MGRNTLHHLTPELLAERLNISLRSVERWRMTGEGPRYIRAGARKILYPLAEVERWETQRMHDSRAAELARST